MGNKTKKYVSKRKMAQRWREFSKKGRESKVIQTNCAEQKVLESPVKVYTEIIPPVMFEENSPIDSLMVTDEVEHRTEGILLYKVKMYPVKNTLDYSNEMNRLFSKPNENDIFQTPPFNVDQSPFNLSSLGRSSSSADSTSPDSYPDISSILSQRTRQNDTRSIAETPFSFRRPIVGRKLIPIEPKQFDFPMTPIAKSFEDEHLMMISRTPPNPTFTNTYELFPTEAKPFEFRTPIKNYTNLSPNSPSFSRMSPLSNSTFSVNSTPKFNQSPNRTINRPNTPSHFHSNHHMGASKKAQGGKMCMFCCKNGETPMVYMSHTVKERVGNKHIVTCPILRSHVCSTCGMTGDDAHTITYCPVLRDHNNGLPLQSTTITLKNTRVKSNGRRRF